MFGLRFNLVGVNVLLWVLGMSVGKGGRLSCVGSMQGEQNRCGYIIEIHLYIYICCCNTNKQIQLSFDYRRKRTNGTATTLESM